MVEFASVYLYLKIKKNKLGVKCLLILIKTLHSDSINRINYTDEKGTYHNVLLASNGWRRSATLAKNSKVFA